MIDVTPTMWDIPGWEAMGWLFVEFPGFSDVRDEYFESDGRFAGFQWDLARQPNRGVVMPGCGGLRKVRWADPRRGLRVIYLLVPEVRVVVLVDLYDKNEADDLTAREKREVARLARETREALLQRLRSSKGSSA